MVRSLRVATRRARMARTPRTGPGTRGSRRGAPRPAPV
ncbi:hypothetical protein SLNWT_1408 [Streptomyces albus]|uniref:Uncharacterized protein n=1 Tax=Streptomyces albus (strain ATCC 21838 / DSM 41398 / FERM P-419 / JCM 4703 / NBRC 107858) TaxID=1081613 RepID=A0A0B5EJV2_STRA4|nr:hypothetical protein SLNWT_1408 [Streptomyces albus]AOU76100.1 hypothetical protein SLNHY_1409 [Streptomyces albus]AYN31892.1 hypothetical protein DUI70_1390 [Streptomyces albus]